MNGLLRPNNAHVKGEGDPCSSRLREERIKAGIDQGRAALACSVSISTYKRWERGAPIPSDALRALADAGMDIQYIVTGIRLSDGVREEVAAYGAAPRDRAIAAAELVQAVAQEMGVLDRLTPAQIGILIGYAYEWAPTRASLRAFFETAMAAGLGAREDALEETE